MKRVLFGAAVLLTILTVSLLAADRMAQDHIAVAALVNRAGREALEENWDTAELLLRAASRRWKDAGALTAMLADQTPVEDVQALLAQLEIFCAQRETTHFAALCAEAALRLTAIADAHRLTIGNLF